MTATCVQAACPAASLAQALLEAWLSGDKHFLRLTVEGLSQMRAVPEADDEFDRVELVKSIACRMETASNMFSTRRESARTGVWLDLLDHLSTAVSLTN